MAADDAPMPLPSFFVVGAFKSGTTSLYHYLQQHPEVALSSLKETNYFSHLGREPGYQGPGDALIWRRPGVPHTLSEYQALFTGGGSVPAIGEVCPLYLYDPPVAERLRRAVPDAKIIALLRQPAERAFSNFMHLIRDGRESHANFADALAAEDERVRTHWEPFWYYRRLGRYYQQLARYYRVFDRARIRIYLFEDFARDPLATLRDLFHFLEIDDTFAPDVSGRHQATGVPRPAALHRLVTRPSAWRSAARVVLPERLRHTVTTSVRTLTRRRMVRPELAPELRAQLTEEFREDIGRTEELTGRDLSRWGPLA